MRLFIACCCISLFISLSAQDVMLQGWYWDYTKPGCNGVPANSPTWATTLGNQAATLGNAGFTYVWLPPASRASFGSCSNGYDPQDLYDLGEYGGGATGFGTRSQVDATIAALNGQGIKAVADVVYNHRDGGAPETNPAVKAYVEQHFTGQMGGGLTQQPFPSDRYRLRLPLGGTYGAGEYYFKISSKTFGFGANVYKFRATVASTGLGYIGTIDESEPNGGGDCGQANNAVLLDQEIRATLFDFSGCYTDEFNLSLSASDFDASGDDLIIFLTNEGGYSDHRIYDVYYDPDGSGPTPGFNIDLNDLVFETYTDFTNLPSGQGAMDFECFKPNTLTAASTFLAGDWDSKLFFYDYDQNDALTQTVLQDWTYWLHTNVGIDGLRMDAVKHFDPAFAARLLDNLASRGWNPDMVVGELFDFSATALADWVNAVDGQMTVSNAIVRIFDFSLRSALKEACDNGGYDARNLFNSSLRDATALPGFNIVTFVNNHDFRDGGQPVQSDPLLAYAYILTNNQLGLPCVFYPDYFGTSIPNAPVQNIQTEIDELIGFQQDYIAGSPSVDYLNRFGTPYGSNYLNGGADQALIYQLPGTGGVQSVIVAINFGNSTLELDHEIGLPGTVGQGTQFLDLTGNAIFPNPTVGNNGGLTNSLYLHLPARSYAVYLQQLSPAPVELIDFWTSAGPADAVTVQWETALEEALSHFEVECAAQVSGPFRAVGQMPARQQPSHYQLVDDRRWLGDQRYYRLKTLELDGTFSYSDLSIVRRETPAEVQIFPQPANEQLIVQGLEAGKHWQLRDLHGRIVQQGQVNSAQLVVETANLAPGMFVFYLPEDGRSYRIVVGR